MTQKFDICDTLMKQTHRKFQEKLKSNSLLIENEESSKFLLENFCFAKIKDNKDNIFDQYNAGNMLEKKKILLQLVDKETFSEDSLKKICSDALTQSLEAAFQDVQAKKFYPFLINLLLKDFHTNLKDSTINFKDVLEQFLKPHRERQNSPDKLKLDEEFMKACILHTFQEVYARFNSFLSADQVAYAANVMLTTFFVKNMKDLIGSENFNIEENINKFFIEINAPKQQNNKKTNNNSQS